LASTHGCGYKEGGQVKPIAPFVFNPHEIHEKLKVVACIKAPSGYVATFKKHVAKQKLSTMKSHDHHIMIQ
jgi:hypothetical protein